MDIIIAHGHGCFDAYEATVDNAIKILSWQTVPNEVKELARATPERLVTYETIVGIIAKLLKSSPGDVIFKSRYNGDQIVATQEAKQQTVMYLFERNIPVGQLSAYELKTKCNIKDLSWLERFHTLPIYEDWITDWAHKLRTIETSNWKAGIDEVRKIRYILEFVNELCHRDEHYEVVPVKSIAS